MLKSGLFPETPVYNCFHPSHLPPIDRSDTIPLYARNVLCSILPQMSTLLICLLLRCVVFLKAKNLEPFFNSSFLLCEFVVVHNVLIDRFEQVNEAKDQERQSTTHRHCGSSLLVSSKHLRTKENKDIQTYLS